MNGDQSHPISTNQARSLVRELEAEAECLFDRYVGSDPVRLQHGLHSRLRKAVERLTDIVDHLAVDPDAKVLIVPDSVQVAAYDALIEVPS